MLWSVGAGEATAVLNERDVFIEVVRSHVGWKVDVVFAKLIFTELLANVIRHGEHPVSVWLECSDGAVKLHILESGRGFAASPRLPSNPLSESGRGLFLVSEFAIALSIQGDPRGTHIVATLPHKGSGASGKASVPRQ